MRKKKPNVVYKSDIEGIKNPIIVSSVTLGLQGFPNLDHIHLLNGSQLKFIPKVSNCTGHLSHPSLLLVYFIFSVSACQTPSTFQSLIPSETAPSQCGQVTQSVLKEQSSQTVVKNLILHPCSNMELYFSFPNLPRSFHLPTQCNFMFALSLSRKKKKEKKGKKRKHSKKIFKKRPHTQNGIYFVLANYS